jgi:hypothetical protein
VRRDPFEWGDETPEERDSREDLDPDLAYEAWRDRRGEESAVRREDDGVSPVPPSTPSKS